MKKTQQQFSIVGMQCVDCENVLEDALQPLPGISKVKADFTTESLTVEFDSDIIKEETISAAIITAGYSSKRFEQKQTGGFFKRLFLILLAIAGITLLFQLENRVGQGLFPSDLEKNLNYGLLFLVGFFTSFHCIGMCGAFVVSYTAYGVRTGTHSYLNHLIYGLGKTVSYSSIGALFGLLGGVITFTLGLRSLVTGLAGGFLIFYGLSMLDTFSGLRRFHIRMPKLIAHSVMEKRRKLSSPLAIGLLNGLMIACGPLQAMYILAAGTGNPWQGAKMLCFFALGTLPIMFAFGYMTSLITANATRNMLKISAIIILAMGAVMLNRSMLILGNGLDLNSVTSRLAKSLQGRFSTWQQTINQIAPVQEGYQLIYMEADASKYMPDNFFLRKDVPVKWIINVKELSSCNKQIVVPSMNMTIDLHPGLQLIEFTPAEAGRISLSCSMGMIPGTIIIKD